MTSHETDHQPLMQRCLQLAALGAGYVAPNPMVGAVLLHGDRIIGEGYHERFGEPHAEVRCLQSVPEADRSLISRSTLFVSLEPCSHFGKTPPCADLIIKNEIPRVVIAVRDPFEAVNGKGIEKLKEAGISVELGLLAREATALNRRFFCFHQQRRPYIVLKWAQTRNGLIARDDFGRLSISSSLTNRLVHRWRSEEASILVGTNTARYDDPQLTNRWWFGPSPTRLVLDRKLKLPPQLKLFTDGVRSIVLTEKHKAPDGPVSYETLAPAASLPEAIAASLHRLQLQSVLVEGGARLLQSFIDAGLWDEARVIQSRESFSGKGIPAPVLSRFELREEMSSGSDTISFYVPNRSNFPETNS